MQNVTTTARETFTWPESVDMARLVFKRFGNDPASATRAWNRLLQNNCDERAFMGLVNAKVHTSHCIGFCTETSEDHG